MIGDVRWKMEDLRLKIKDGKFVLVRVLGFGFYRVFSVENCGGD